MVMDIDNVKTRFPFWAQYLTSAADELDGVSADDLLVLIVGEAETKYQDYAELDDPPTDSQVYHLMAIIRYRAFLMRHGDTKFDVKPPIIRDYEATLKLLESGMIGGNSIRMTAKDRIMDVGFKTAWDEAETISTPRSRQ